ncbi:protein-disulfide reductase DsbD family protein [Pseudoluteimonas lycopersici]|uniref:protein-disulfide reductase DsbD family protein n=1 Tax=Pseudoluteimonas lycopersici TaxID=1324796 RepID=UPI00387EC226
MPSFLRAFAALLLCAAPLLPARAAIDPSELPPVDSVFVLSANAEARDKIAVDWKIADGFYLYRHRTKADSPDGSFANATLSLPSGAKHHDEFFGDVETYRGRLAGSVSGDAGDRDRVTLRIKYQGCADAGVCYPPQTRTLTIALPAAAGAGDDALLPGTSNRGSLFATTKAGATDDKPLPPEQAFGFEAIAGDGNALLLRFTPARGYYLYRDRTTLKLEDAPGIATGKPRWPKGTRHHDEHFGDVVVYFDQIDVPLPLKRTNVGAAKATLVATFQGCQTDGICYPPMTRRIALAIPRGTLATSVAEGPKEPVLPESNADTASTDTTTTSTAVATAPSASEAANPPRELPPATSHQPPTTNSLLASLLFALLGGLILNLMPCVLPVLSLKALSLTNSGESRSRARAHALWYTAGVLAAFAALGALALALRKAGLALGWGFQLQQPLVVAAIALLLFALGLSLSGVWYPNVGIGARGNAWMQKHGAAGDFATGVLAVVLATPCIGPFMGAALAYAFAGPALGGMLVFLALGLGLALPFLLIGFVPALAQRLPKPGAWMETFKQLMAFPMYLTTAWLVSVLAAQRGGDAVWNWMLAAIAVALAAWAWTRSRMQGVRWGSVLAIVALFAMLWPLQRIHALPPAHAGETTSVGATTAMPYSKARLASLRSQGQVVFVDITADWCITCKANEKAVLSREAFRDALQAANATYMVGDYTDLDPAITAYLQRHGAVGIPLYVVYPRGGGEGKVLPTVLTPELVRDALAQATQ